MLWLWLACAPTPHTDLDAVTLQTAGVLARIFPATGGCGGRAPRIEMYGPSWTTDGDVPATVTTEDRVTWARFPIVTGLGDGEMVLRLQGDDAVIPFGARPGEFDLTLDPSPEPPAPEALSAARAAAAAGVAREAEAWRRGAFLLQDGADTVGEIRLSGAELPPQVSVHDETWLTPAPVSARRRDDGGDLLLQFPVEPALESEEGMLRVNLLTRQVVVPSGAVPDPVVDRRLLLVPGALTDAEREEKVAQAGAEAERLEAELLGEQLPLLLRAARRSQCAPIESLGAPWTLFFKGYKVKISEIAEGCRVQVSPSVEQHRRRTSRVIEG